MIVLRHPMNGETLFHSLGKMIGLIVFMAAILSITPGRGIYSSQQSDTWHSCSMVIFGLSFAEEIDRFEPRVFPFARSASAYLISSLGKYLWWTLTGNENVSASFGLGAALHGENETMTEVVGKLVEHYGVHQCFFYFIAYAIFCSYGFSSANLVRGCVHYYRQRRQRE